MARALRLLADRIAHGFTLVYACLLHFRENLRQYELHRHIESYSLYRRLPFAKIFVSVLGQIG